MEINLFKYLWTFKRFFFTNTHSLTHPQTQTYLCAHAHVVTRIRKIHTPINLRYSS